MDKEGLMMLTASDVFFFRFFSYEIFGLLLYNNMIYSVSIYLFFLSVA